MSKLEKHIFLIGFMGAGKSTVAEKLQEMLDADVMEMDKTIVRLQGMTITEIFEKFGEECFRNIESEVLMNLKGRKAEIISCGGGIVLREENVACMKEIGKVVFLSASAETIYERVKDSTERPILNGNMNVEYIRELMEKRQDKYEAAADVVIDTDGKTVEDICREIIGSL